MKSLILPVLVAVVLLAAATAVAEAGDVYTWTDENGVVHYGDQPPPGGDAKVIEAPEAYRPGSADAYQDIAAPETDPGAPAATGTEGEAAEPEAELSYADQKRQEMAQRRTELQQQANQRATTCARAQQRLAQIEPNPRVIYIDETGEAVRMDDDERVAEVEEQHRLIAENCDSE